MRDIPEALAARIESGAATLCHVWIVTRADGTRSGFTDHDRALEIDGVACAAASGWGAGAAEARLGCAPGDASAAGTLDDDGLTEADIAAGFYDGAKVELRRVDWSLPELGVELWRGTIDRIRREGDAFVAELAGPMAVLDRVVGRTFGRSCDAVLGDGRCRADLTGRPDATCDKRWETCVRTFGNGVNFQGFPDIPGDDYLTAVPVEGGRHDGGSRR